MKAAGKIGLLTIVSARALGVDGLLFLTWQDQAPAHRSESVTGLMRHHYDHGGLRDVVARLDIHRRGDSNVPLWQAPIAWRISYPSTAIGWWSGI
jgi:hypothetical protein